jgi:type I restriction enzyme R subunit
MDFPKKKRTLGQCMAVPVYSSNQEDGKPSEDKYIDKLAKT